VSAETCRRCASAIASGRASLDGSTVGRPPRGAGMTSTYDLSSVADGQVQRTVAGTPQGGVFSPVMCNVYLHRLDRAWDDGDGCWSGSLMTWS
jgi:hypothetical protein